MFIVLLSSIVNASNVWNHATCNCENEKYLASIMDDSKLSMMKL